MLVSVFRLIPVWEIQFVEVDLFHQIEKIEKIKLEFLIYQALNRSRSSNIGFSENIFLFLGFDPEKYIVLSVLFKSTLE